jgi:hypothetical protein
VAIVTSKGIAPGTVHSTPRAVTRALLSHLAQQPYTRDLLQRGASWDCACGSMAIIRELKAFDPPARSVVSSDVHPREGATIAKPLDFTKLTTPPDNLAHRPRFIVTNPPFSLATQFMDVGLRWTDGVPGAALALFLPLGALGGQKRATTVYSTAPPSQILILSERVDIFPDGYVPPAGKHQGGVIEYGWFLWYNDSYEGRLMTPAELAAHEVPPLAWVLPGVLGELDPEAVHEKKARATRNKQRAAALSRDRKNRGTVRADTSTPNQPETDHG